MKIVKNFLFLSTIFLLLTLIPGKPLYSDVKVPFIFPLHGKIITGFREKYWNQENQEYLHHTGIDIKGDRGTEIIASGNGYVSYVGFSPIGGKTVVIKHNKKIRSTYLNLSTILVSCGDYVRQGEKIATIGASSDPSSEEPHLHFGVIYNGKYINPEDILKIDYNSLSKYIYLNYMPKDFYFQTHLLRSPAKNIW
ncbi:MAG: M23 family metallopeptidase [Candidatus Humimicrobiaceae bacterium]